MVNKRHNYLLQLLHVLIYNILVSPRNLDMFFLNSIPIYYRVHLLYMYLHAVSDSEEIKVWDSASDIEDSCVDQLDDDEVPELPSIQASLAEEKALIVWLLIFILRLQANHSIPDVALTCLIKFFFIFFTVIGRTNSYIATIASSFPNLFMSCARSLALRKN